MRDIPRPWQRVRSICEYVHSTLHQWALVSVFSMLWVFPKKPIGALHNAATIQKKRWQSPLPYRTFSRCARLSFDAVVGAFPFNNWYSNYADGTSFLICPHHGGLRSIVAAAGNVWCLRYGLGRIMQIAWHICTDLLLTAAYAGVPKSATELSCHPKDAKLVPIGCSRLQISPAEM
jgi:hypothetical protein